MLRKMTGILFISLVVAIVLFIFTQGRKMHRENGNYLKKEEELISSRYGRSKEAFRLCSYPSPSDNISIYTKESLGSSANKMLRIRFVRGEKNFYGLHFDFTFVLRPYLRNGFFEFYVKSAESASFLNNLEIYLKEGPFKNKMVKYIMRIDISSEWIKISIPIKRFTICEGGKFGEEKEFSWEIQEILFSVSSLETDKAVLLFRNIVIKERNNIIYEIL